MAVENILRSIVMKVMWLGFKLMTPASAIRCTADCPGEPDSSHKMGCLMVCENQKSELVVVLLFNDHAKQLWSCWHGQLTQPHFSWAGLDLFSG